MGLRFRKSVTLCKGVKLNFGKTGMSVTLGQEGYHKTIHQNGKVTTSVGLPGTGIYWTDTKSLNSSGRNNSTRRVVEDRQVQTEYIGHQRGYEIADEVPVEEEWVRHVSEDAESHEAVETGYTMHDDLTSYFSKQPNLQQEYIQNPSGSCGKNQIKLTEHDIYQIYQNADDSVDWTEILVSTSENDVFLSKELWKYYKSVAGKILKGDIDTYLQVIEVVRPLDDLLSFGGNFEFGTDNAGYMEIEFDVMPEEVLGQEYNIELFCDYICAASIRVARDLFALLPVGIVIVHAVLSNQTVLSVLFNRHEMNRISFRSLPQEIINQFRHNMKKNTKMESVNRISI